MRRLVLATTNTGKIREIRGMLEGVAVDLVGLEQWPDLPAPEETGRTFAENARLKALYYAHATGLAAVADDSGLEIDALGGEPGVGSARFLGDSVTYPQRFAEIYRRLDSAGQADSPARFVCAVALAQTGQLRFEARGVIEGRITRPPRGEHGFGYDPIFLHPPSGRTTAELTPAEKAAVSHRGQAFAALRRYLLTQE